MLNELCGMSSEENGFVAALHYTLRAISKIKQPTLLLLRQNKGPAGPFGGVIERQDWPNLECKMLADSHQAGIAACRSGIHAEGVLN